MNCIVAAWGKHEQELRIFLLGKLRDAMLVDDLLQDTFVKALEKGAGFCELEQPRAWLFRVARNNMVDYLRRNPQLVELDEDVSREAQDVSGIKSLSACLPQAVAALGEEDQEAIRLCDLEGLKQAEYARQKGLSLAATKSRIQRARKRLKQQLKTHCGVRYYDSGNICCYDTSKC